MRTLQIIVFIALALPIFGQTKTDFVDCLNIIFDQHEFQPAFTNHESTNGHLIIVATRPRLLRDKTTKLNHYRQSLTNDDFRSTGHYVKILRPEDLVNLGIPNNAGLEIYAAGDDSKILFTLVSIIWGENQQYTWSYSLRKVADKWEIIGSNLDKTGVNLLNLR